MKGDFKKAKSLFIQIIIVFLLFAVAIYGLWRIDLLKLPTFIENILTPTSQNADDYAGDGYEIFEYLVDENSTEIESLYPEIKLENLSEILSNAEQYENYYWESTSEVIHGNSSKIKLCKSRISGKRYNIEIGDDKGNTVSTCISDGNKTYVTRFSGNNTTSYTYSKGIIDFYSDAGIVSIDSLNNIDFSDDNCEIRNIDVNNLNLISISYSHDDNGVLLNNNYLLSLDFGVILYAECLENGKTIYKLNTTSIYPLESLDDELFNVD